MNELMKYHETIKYIYIVFCMWSTEEEEREKKKKSNTWRGEKLPKSVNDDIVFVLFGGGVSTLRN